MKNFKLLGLFIVTIIFSNCAENKSNNNDEQKIRDLIALYDEAAVKNDIGFFETNLASDYRIATSEGGLATKEEQLKHLKEEIEKPSYKLISLKSDSVEVRVIGDAAVVSGKWLSTTQALDDPNPVMHNDEGRYTSILEKRDGKWIMVSEQVSEKPHNKKELETQLKAASESYDTGLIAKDEAFFKDLFAEDYASTNTEGKVTTKAEDIAQIISPDLVFTTSKTEDKNFRIYRNTAIETGKFSSTGSYKGEPFSEIGRYTTTWLYRDGKWKIVADHTSPIRDSK
ncbi:MAG TPA: nuclear transport factor 2 family protein [Aequorivita sp.]|nr:nuclear transport factor 2 family protein [Aequorivita sp.]